MSAINKDFLRAVFTGEKLLFKKPDVKFVAVSHWDELAVKNLWPAMRQDKAFNKYFQDEYPKEKAPPREYFFNVLNTLYPDYLTQLRDNASKQRFAIEGDEAKRQAIYATESWYTELATVPFMSGK